MKHTTHLAGEDLLLFVRAGADELVAETVINALRVHMETGQSLDAILGLTATRSGEKTARRNEILHQRGVNLLRAYESILTADPETSQWDAAGIILDGMSSGHPDFVDIRELGDQVGLTWTTQQSVYHALGRIETLS